MFVIWTRYVNPKGKIIRHAFGPYPTRAKAQTALKKMIRESYDIEMDNAEAQVTKLIGDHE
jgi:hypothetical protein